MRYELSSPSSVLTRFIRRVKNWTHEWNTNKTQRALLSLFLFHSFIENVSETEWEEGSSIEQTTQNPQHIYKDESRNQLVLCLSHHAVRFASLLWLLPFPLICKDPVQDMAIVPPMNIFKNIGLTFSLTVWVRAVAITIIRRWNSGCADMGVASLRIYIWHMTVL